MGASQQSSSSKLQVAFECADEGPLVRLRGAATMDQADLLRDHLLALAPTLNGQIILDLTDLEFICSLGLGAIVAAHLRCQRLGGGIRLVNPTPPILQLLTLTQLDRLFGVFPSAAEARRTPFVSVPSAAPGAAHESHDPA